MKNYSYADIQEITQKGITLKDGFFIDFSACVMNARERFNVETTSCVAERDYAANFPYFLFYTTPNVKIEFNTHKGLFAKRKSHKEFWNFQLALQAMNVTTYDLA